MSNELKPCPFCGGEADYWSCDRLIKIGCKPCGFSLGFDGIVQSAENDVPVKSKEGNVVGYYHQNADKVAKQKWNTRSES